MFYGGGWYVKIRISCSLKSLTDLYCGSGMSLDLAQLGRGITWKHMDNTNTILCLFALYSGWEYAFDKLNTEPGNTLQLQLSRYRDTMQQQQQKNPFFFFIYLKTIQPLWTWIWPAFYPGTLFSKSNQPSMILFQSPRVWHNHWDELQSPDSAGCSAADKPDWEILAHRTN